MAISARPVRSVLYIPGSNARALDKARTLPADAIIFDLEDAVSPQEKANARAQLTAFLTEGGYGSRLRLVRVNGLDTEWGRDDVAALAATGPDGILLPKVNDADDVQGLASVVPEIPLWAMIETCLGVLKAAEIAAHPRMEGFVMGTNDLARELNCRDRADRMPMLTSLQVCLPAARAHGVTCIDGVYNAFKDQAGLAAECEQGRDMGFDGKSLIHPAQIATANTAFSPTEAELDLSRRQIAAFDAAEAKGSGVAVLDGRIVENLHIETARATLAKAAAIAAMEE